MFRQRMMVRNNSNMPTKTAKGLARVRVIRHIPQGLSVELDNGQRGIIRIREISWSEENITNWKSIYPVGWRGLALSIPSQKGEAHEFSLRLAESDPWDEFVDGLEKGQTYEGVVTSVVDYGAFVEIIPGLTGLLHQSQLPSWCKNSPMDLFWPGDKMFVTIREANQDQRQIGLGIPPLKPLDEEKLSKTTALPIVTRDADHDLEKLLEPDSPRKHILVVENEKPQAIAVSGWLRRLNQRVDVVDSAERAVDFLEKTQPDIALVDVGLSGMSGTDLADHIIEKYPHVQIINITDWARANEIMDTLVALQARGAKLLLKPLLPEDLVPYLLQEQIQGSKLSKEEGALEEKLTLADVPKLDANKSIQILLQRCRKHLGFEQIILFSLDPIHRRAVILERAGDGLLNKNALPYLIYSPVRDVAEDHEPVVVNEISEKERNRFRYLSELCPSTVSCIGVPVPTQTPSDYALFVLDKRARQITNEQQLYVEGMALAIGTALDQNNLKEKFVLMQRTALIGHLTRAMMHEINNLVGPLLYGADSLKRSLAQFEKDPGKPDYGAINKDIANIQQDIRKIISTTKTFGRIVAKGKHEVIRVDEIIYETLSLLKDISDRAHVTLQFTPPDDLVVIRSQAVVFEQIFLNVLLNAVQQISELRPEAGGWVKVSMELVNEVKAGAMCRILVEDNGPGIHASHWEKIFEAGFTTRVDGSGIGLYISRNLMDDLGGKVYVSKSHILSGTLFVLEFPIRL
jgi:signal transduction histidine kinase/DNA-binding NarL/FixJ family response regulator/predicted RNA-binding protein with RPS1 domain